MTSQEALNDAGIASAWVGEAPKLESTVTLADYDPEWPKLFEREAGRIRGVLGDRVLVLEHVGSTSVPGLCAKPIIDILLEVPDSDDEDAYVPALEAAGYRLVIREPDWEKHRCFKGPDTDINLHVYSPGNGQTERYRLLRERMRAHPEERDLYVAKKRELAAKTWKYIQNYADAKTEVIEEILGRARAAQYDAFSEDYAEHAEKSVTNALYDRPAIVDLAGDVEGKRVLDAGCAAGHLSALLAGRGADVLGVDASAGMVAVARRKFGDVARFEQADITRPLDVEDGSIDVVTASLVLHYLKDWGPALAEFRRVLKPGGLLVFSVHHPGEDWRWFGKENYFEVELLEDEFPPGQRVRFYRRPLSRTFQAVRDAGFDVDRLVEPMPVPETDEADPNWAANLRTKPRFLYFRAVSPASPARG
ncbi:methyltransferase domain-containing protein [Amycolatopsis balhimycina DSM 5908]|uniref:Methyltransferase domain-containing protein n=1 Tax=Amycolatopsis balhimycina DSM 5908 TaxID=1081091 RepID=A0A428W2L6_AMYBA|nr:GrpB family protein [Amycolatopsis balhimycina]RSM37296.1 methyltransferase domain-containing protein [Amycolatopsis balhimycina DSM 5908]